MNPLFAACRDPMFWVVPVTAVLLSMVAFRCFAGALTAVAGHDPAGLRRRNIHCPHGAKLSDAESRRILAWIRIVRRQWEAAGGHAGYDFPWTPTHWLPGSRGALHHDFHHARVRGHYAGFFPVRDRLFGTLGHAAAVADWRRRRDRASAA